MPFWGSAIAAVACSIMAGSIWRDLRKSQRDSMPRWYMRAGWALYGFTLLGVFINLYFVWR